MVLLDSFYKLIRISAGKSAEDFPFLDSNQWYELYALAQQQAIVGVLSRSIEKLSKEKRPPREIVLRWMLATERIRQLNQHLYKIASNVEALFNNNDFKSCILKGLGIAQLYPNPELRTSGDIDIWVNGSRKEIISFVGKFSKSSHAVYHHIDGLKVEGVEIETHFTPSYMANPFANRRLQKWIQAEKTKQFENTLNLCEDGQIHVPTLAFNRVFILHHIYRHFFYEGIGLRQMMDFYYVLKLGFSKEEQDETIRTYKKLNLLNFAGAVVYVLREIFGLEKEFFITPPNTEYGKILLSEIIAGGNFGQVIHKNKQRETKLQRGWRIITRSWKFFRFAPSEVFWMPYFKVVNNLVYVKTYININYKKGM